MLCGARSSRQVAWPAPTDGGARLVDFEALRSGDRLPKLPLSLTSHDVRLFVEATGGAPAERDDLIPPHCLWARALACALDVMPMPPTSLHVGNTFQMLRSATTDREYVVSLELEARSTRGDTMVSRFSMEITDAGDDMATMVGTVTVVS